MTGFAFGTTILIIAGVRRKTHALQANTLRASENRFQIFFTLLNCTLKKTKGAVIILTLYLIFTKKKFAAASAFVFSYPYLPDKV